MKIWKIHIKCRLLLIVFALVRLIPVSMMHGAGNAGSDQQPPIAEVRDKALLKIQCIFRPFCFSGNRFPEGEVKDFAAARSLFGSYKVRATYYDEQFNLVTSADKPGRYGAIVEIHPEQGDVVKRYSTLYCLPPGAVWPPATLPMSAELLAQLGIDPTVAEEQKGTLEGNLKGKSGEDFLNSPDSALILAWLRTTVPGTRPAKRDDPWTTNLRWIHELKRKTNNLVPLDYRVQLPAGFNNSSRKKWPAILYLHGSGGRDLSMEEVANLSLPGYAKAHKKDFPFILVTPHCPKDSGWQVPALDDLWAEVTKKYPVDPDRVYLTGESLGGGACWTLAIEHPDRYAAMAPVSGGGGGDAQEVDRIKDLPVWDFHGLVDYDVLIQRSYDRVGALRKLNGRVRFTVYPEGDHYIWDDVYSRKELYTWMLAQVRGKPAQPGATIQGTDPSDERELKIP